MLYYFLYYRPIFYYYNHLLYKTNLLVNILCRPQVRSGDTQNNWRFSEADSGMKADLDETSTPLQCFQTLFTDEIAADLVKSINTYGMRKQQATLLPSSNRFTAKWVEITISELWKFFAVIIQIGLSPKPSIRDYWA